MLTYIEAVAVISALLYLYFAARDKVICFLFGLISSALYIYICVEARYYFDAFINAYYVVMSVIGWFNWKKLENKTAVAIRRIGSSLLIGLILTGLALTALMGYIGQTYLGSSLPYLDGFTTVFAIIGTWMVVSKFIENWLIWIVVDVISTGMYFYKELYFTAVLFFISTVIAVIGFIEWKSKLNNPI